MVTQEKLKAHTARLIHITLKCDLRPYNLNRVNSTDADRCFRFAGQRLAAQQDPAQTHIEHTPDTLQLIEANNLCNSTVLKEFTGLVNR